MSFPNSPILEILISLTLIYAILSILVSILMEWWNHYVKARARLLKESIYHLLKDPLNRHYGELFYGHFMISGLQSGPGRSPQYISSAMFAEVLIDVIAKQMEHCQEIKLKNTEGDAKEYEVAGDPPPQELKERFEKALRAMKPSPFSDVLRSFWDKSGGDLAQMKALIEKWFNDYMDRVSGWYKNRQKKKFIFFGMAVALALNVDSIHLFKVLSMDDTLRTKLVATAENVADQYQAMADSGEVNYSRILDSLARSAPDSLKPDSAKPEKVKSLVSYLAAKDSARYNPYIRKLRASDSLSQRYAAQTDSILGLVASLGIPVGWNPNTAPLSWHLRDLFKKDPQRVKRSKSQGLMAYNEHRNNHTTWSNVILWAAGICISGFSLSFGAPFWFDLLVKFVNIRRAGNKPKSNNSKK